MKKIMKAFVLFYIVCLLLVSCPCLYSTTAIFEQKIIAEYPVWCSWTDKNKDLGDAVTGFGYSEWKDWQGNDGKLLHSLVDDSIVSDNENCKYRLLMVGQHLCICFNDSASKFASVFAFIGNYEHYENRIVKIDTSSDKVEYDCWIRPYHDEVWEEKCTDSNKGKVVLTKIDDNSFNYKMTMNEKTIVDTTMVNGQAGCGKAQLTKKYSWFPTFAFSEVIGDDYSKNGYYGHCKIGFDFDSNTNLVEVFEWGMNSMYCFEGVSLRSVDEENKKISFNLLDAAESGFADYMEIHITKEDWTDEPKRGATSKNRCLMKGTLGFYKEGYSTPVRFYDENHSEFSRRLVE